MQVGPTDLTFPMLQAFAQDFEVSPNLSESSLNRSCIQIVSRLFHCACVAQWIGRVTLNVVSADSTPPMVETKNNNWVAPLWFVYIYTCIKSIRPWLVA